RRVQRQPHVLGKRNHTAGPSDDIMNGIGHASAVRQRHLVRLRQLSRNNRHDSLRSPFVVVPAKAGTQCKHESRPQAGMHSNDWIPAFAGMTEMSGLVLEASPDVNTAPCRSEPARDHAAPEPPINARTTMQESQA